MPLRRSVASSLRLFFPLSFLACVPPASAGSLNGTLDFRNVTAARIHQTVAEVQSNEKEVEYGDFDNDGDLDVVIANAYSDFGTRKNKLYRNDDGVFNEISGGPAIPGFTTADVARNAFFRDYDLDGWLDIIIVCDANTAGDGGRTKIYMNQHPGGAFASFNEEGLVRLGASTGGAACGGNSIDADMDGDWDLYVGNYPGPSQDTMYFNNGAGFFASVTGNNVPVDSDYTVDVASADLNGDGRLDLLVSNTSGGDKVSYNNKLLAGSGTGDFSYPGSVQVLGAPSGENAMEPGDFDNDGDQDIYWSNRVGAADRVYRNQGNDAAGAATFTELSNLPASVLTVTSRKATVSDLDGDGRLDVFVMKEAGVSSRPTVLRNVTVNGAIQFVDWSPAPAFPSNATHMGWHAAAFDGDGDGDRDIFLGGWTNDHFFENVTNKPYQEAELSGGVIPQLYNGDPAAVVGSAGANVSDTYTVESLTASAFLSAVLNGADDYRLDLLDGSGNLLSVTNRGGAGVEEATQYDPVTMPATVRVRVTVLACANPYSIAGDCGVGIEDFLDLLGAWGPNPGHPADFDQDGSVGINDFLDLLGAWGDSPYLLEVLARAG
jgi:hypothetical protein